MSRYQFMLASIAVGLVLGFLLGLIIKSMYIGLGLGFLGGVVFGLFRTR
jgi:hypothetical protein